MSPPNPEEARRQASLDALQVLDSAPEPLFDTLVQTAAEFCGVPIALVSLIDAERQWFKAQVGLPGVAETPRAIAFCDHAIRSDALFEVSDARQDPRFADNPLVTGDPDIRFYAGAPLVLAGGERVGTLCVIDREPRQLTPAQAALLGQLARATVQALEMRRRLVDQALALREVRQDALSASEAQLRTILEAQTDLVSQADAQGRLLYVNPAYAAHFGRTVEQTLGTALLDYVDPADRALVSDRLAWVLSTGQSLVGENRMVGPDGEERWIAWTNVRQLDPAGQPVLHSTGRDVSARVRAERAWRASREALARTGRLARVGGWDLDIDSGAVSWTDETRRIHEVAADFQPTLDTAISFYAPEARPQIEAAVQRALSSGEPWDLELALVTATGRQIWVRAVGEAERVDGRAVRLVGAFQEITEQRRLQLQAAESERFLRQLTDSLPLRIAYLDSARRYRFVNQAWCRQTGLARDQVLGRTRAELFPDQDDSRLARRALAALAGEPQRFERDERVAGVLRRFEQRLEPDRDDAGAVRGFFVTGVDVTERSAAELALRELTAIFDNTTDLVLQADPAGALLYMNPSARQALGLAADAPLGGRTLQSLSPPATERLYAQEILPALARGPVWLGQSSVWFADGQARPVSHMVIAHRDGAGRLLRLSVLLRDISDAVAAQLEILRQAATLRSVADAIPFSVFVVDAQGKYRFVNRAFEAAAGRPAAEILGRGALEVLGQVDFERRRPWIMRVLAGERVRFELDIDNATGRSHVALEYVPLTLPNGDSDGFVAVTQDITQQVREQARLQVLSQTDALTGLLNRTGFEQHVAGLLDPHRPTAVAVLYIDLDRFKPVNDTHGHAAGDEVLKALAGRLAALVRPSDLIARIGGDEFAVLLQDMQSANQTERIAQAVVAAAAAPFLLGNGIEIGIGASVGAALGQVRAGDWSALLDKADRLLYQAKSAGRSQVALEAG